ncbi:hypothetical protein M2451_001522 [Dysgonomonas sp. PFB1-18]|nr:hypothetical protein [Dysgonomonas sp. PF1-14]MDH6338771.1 hypothetical protein [Dysgonomonas sp. PF1-16]MDH6380201.1 hypothetical protein [Dysgonomonas sp. PFB1-18]MDH6397531.1 hypothetical protein [Dysgonomonas sp. PF1-23]
MKENRRKWGKNALQAEGRRFESVNAHGKERQSKVKILTKNRKVF